MNFAQYYIAIKEKLELHNMIILNCVAQDFFDKDFSVDQVVQEFLKYEKKPKFQEEVLTIKDLKTN